MFVDYGLKQPSFEIIPGGFAVTVFAANNVVKENVTENVTENRILTLLKLIRGNNKISTQNLVLAH